MPTPFHQKTAFWVFLLSLALAAALAAYQLSQQHLPIVHLKQSLSQAQAQALAQNLQKQLFPQLHTQHTASIFVTDRWLQNYIELEAGGVAAFNGLVNNLDAVTHYWKVRQFSLGQVPETIMAFSPTGAFISFDLKIPDAQAGPAWPPDQAQRLAEAEAEAKKLIGDRFNAYSLLESNTKTQANGRVDHQFIYQHQTLTAAEARFRLSLKVSGDQFTQLDTFKFIPNAFDKRFGALRALNDTLQQTANYAVMGLFGLFGLLGGGLWLYRKQQLQLKPAFILGAGLALGVTCAQFSFWPAALMGLDTTQTLGSFISGQAGRAIGTWIAMALLATTLFAVAEGLSRNAFGQQVQLFQSFRPEVLASPQLLKQVLGAYAWTGYFLCYAAVFAYVSHTYWGWWSPADVHSNPEILASSRPALPPIFTALQAGAIEECLFRAIPLAGAALIGARWGIRRPLILCVLILQALIFAAAHSNYPNLPGYSRLVELLLPALVFGLVYLRLGLIIGILAHFLYDLVLMSLPLFLSHTAELGFDKTLVLAAGSLPLLAVFWARWRQGQWVALAPKWLNQAYTAPLGAPKAAPSASPNTSAPQTPTLGTDLNLKPVWLVLLIGLGVGLQSLQWQRPRPLQWPQMSLPRAQVEPLARAHLEKIGVHLGSEWRSTLHIQAGLSASHTFVWQQLGAAGVQALLGQYLDPPYWVIHWKIFEGPLEGRSEDWRVFLTADGSLARISHSLPEAASGARVTREHALETAYQWIQTTGWAQREHLEEVAIYETTRPNRSDWNLTFNNKNALRLSQGGAHITLTLAGDSVADAYRSLQVPEDWQRQQDAQAAAKAPFHAASTLIFLTLVAISLWALYKHRRQCPWQLKALLPWVAVVFCGYLGVGFLWRDSGLEYFNPTRDWNTQFIEWQLSNLFGALLPSVFMGFIAHLLLTQRPLHQGHSLKSFVKAFACACGLFALQALINRFFPSVLVPSAYVADLSTPYPTLTTVLNGFKSLVFGYFILVVTLGLVRFSQGRTWAAVGVCSLAAVQVVIYALSQQEPLRAGLENGLQLTASLFCAWLIIRQRLTLAIAFTGCTLALQQWNVAYALYPAAPWHALASVAACLAVTFFWVHQAKGVNPP